MVDDEFDKIISKLKSGETPEFGRNNQTNGVERIQEGVAFEVSEKALPTCIERYQKRNPKEKEEK